MLGEKFCRPDLVSHKFHHIWRPMLFFLFFFLAGGSYRGGLVFNKFNSKCQCQIAFVEPHVANWLLAKPRTPTRNIPSNIPATIITIHGYRAIRKGELFVSICVTQFRYLEIQAKILRMSCCIATVRSDSISKKKSVHTNLQSVFLVSANIQLNFSKYMNIEIK